MSPFLGLAKIKKYTKEPSKLRRFIATPVYLNIVIVVCIAVVGLFYLLEVNQATTKGYKMRDLEKKIQQVEDANNKLELEVTELQALNNIQERVKSLGMVPTDKVKYIKTPDSSVAVK